MDATQRLSILHGLAFRQAVWLFPAAFILHVIEEWPRFVTWANRYASQRFTARDYAVIHLSGIVGAVFVAALLSWARPRPLVFLFFAFLFLPGLFWNVLFHLGATAVFRAYSPGLITALFVYPPVVYLVSRCAYREGLLSLGSWAAALVIGGLFHFWEVGHNVFKAW